MQTAAGSAAQWLVPGRSVAATCGPDERPEAVCDVRAFGARGDGAADDAGALQAAVDAAASAFDAAGVDLINRVSSAPPVYFPAGRYRLDRSIVVRRPLALVGTGPLNSVLRSQADAPVLVVDNAVLRSYLRPRVEGLAIVGDGTTGAKPNQHGLELRYTSSGGDAGVDCIDVAIAGMGGHGVYCPHNSNTARFVRVAVQTCWGDGLHFSGDFHTNSLVTGCIIRENRRGIVYDGRAVQRAGGYLYSGVITANLIESNINGSGRLGSETRPGQGITLHNTRELTITGNYFERHLNHVYGSGAVAYCVIRDNNFCGASGVPGEFRGQGGPLRQACDVFLEGDSNTGMLLASNFFEQPRRPAGTPAEDWGTTRWGDTYPIIPVLTGTRHVIADNPKFALTCGDAVRPASRSGYNGLDLAQDCNQPALTLTTSEGRWEPGDWTGLRCQAGPADAAGRVELRFVRGTTGAGDVEVWGAPTGDLRRLLRIRGDTGDIELAAGVTVGLDRVVGPRQAAVNDVRRHAGREYGSNEQRMLEECREAINQILRRLRAGSGHGLIES